MMFCDTFIWGIENSSTHTYDSRFSHVSFLWHGVIYLQPAQSAAEAVQSGNSEKSRKLSAIPHRETGSNATPSVALKIHIFLS